MSCSLVTALCVTSLSFDPCVTRCVSNLRILYGISFSNKSRPVGLPHTSVRVKGSASRASHLLVRAGKLHRMYTLHVVSGTLPTVRHVLLAASEPWHDQHGWPWQSDVAAVYLSMPDLAYAAPMRWSEDSFTTYTDMYTTYTCLYTFRKRLQNGCAPCGPFLSGRSSRAASLVQTTLYFIDRSVPGCCDPGEQKGTDNAAVCYPPQMQHHTIQAGH